MLKKIASVLAIIFSIIILNLSNACAMDKEATVTEKIINKDSQYIEIRAKLPIIETPKSEVGKEITRKINDKFEATVVDVTSLAESAKDKDTGFIGKYEIFTEYKVPYNNSILSLYTTDYQFTGGAHGMTTINPYNINLRTSKELKLSNIFKKDFDYKSFINEKVNKKIEENPSIYFTDEEYKFKTILDNQDFYITDEGLVIIFQLYDIAPYSSGIQEVIIPKGEIESKVLEKLW